ncbi:uncharacterized protein LOC107658231 isoform X2 [Sinocyclocheilus anshuiensis]|uniref:uncharacterized protein LOC107658231 isoform X2 n=1 Tax=Sinocyclocheilus anshuiensis TaxID=1608454 RepID=UPI0007BA044C|nr:PREDICTED: uncharacterized protein LOC107658231 isoform X2 [Sinocyclocheilus anshuiensis]
MVSTTELQKTKGTFLHKLTARAIIRDYEDGILGNSEAEHEGKKAELKSYITELSKEFSILSQFTSFVAIEERDQNELDTGFTDIPKIISEDNVDILPYMGWTEEKLKTVHIIVAEDGIPMESERCSSSSTSEEILGSAHEAADFDDDDSEDDYESVNDFIEQASAVSRALPRSKSLWRPSRFEGSTDTFRGCLKTKPVVTYPHHLSIEHGALMDAPSPLFLQELGEPLCMDNRLSPPPPSGGASMSVRHPPPDASQVTASMPPLLDLPCYFEAVESLLDYSLDFHTPIGASVDALRPQCRHLRHELMEPPSMVLPPPATQLSSATEFATELYTSTTPVCADLPHPPRLASQQFMSMTSSPAPPPTLFGSVGASFSRRHRAAAPIVFDQPAMSAPPSLPRSGGFGGFLQQSNESLGFGSSDSGLFGASLQNLATLSSASSTHSAAFTPAPPLPAHSVLFGQPTVPKYATGMSNAVAYGSTTGVLQKTTEPEQYRGFSVSSFGASQQQQKYPVFSAAGAKVIPKLRGKMALSFRGKQISRPHTVAWNELFELQHEDGYWECTDRLSSFLNLDVDFFANVFLKEKGIRSFGVKAHADILRLVATLLVLQLIRVKKLAVGQLLESLLRLKESQEPRPMYWEAVKRAVAWACRTDRQYPCVCSRLEIGRDWESSTRQLLGCDSPHPYSPLKPVLERRTGVSVM